MPASVSGPSTTRHETTSLSVRAEFRKHHKSPRSFVCDRSCRTNVRARSGQARCQAQTAEDSRRHSLRTRRKTASRRAHREKRSRCRKTPASASGRNRERTDVDVHERLRSKFLAKACAFESGSVLARNHVPATSQDPIQIDAPLDRQSLLLQHFVRESSASAGFPESIGERKSQRGRVSHRQQTQIASLTRSEIDSDRAQ